MTDRTDATDATGAGPRQPPRASAWLQGSDLGLPVSVFAALALAATCLARALAPALPGSATGISTLIVVTSFAAACTSQLVAAGGIALCLRLLSRVLLWPGLGVAFRIVIVPASLGVVALTIGSAAQPLDPELGRIAAIAALVASAAAAPPLLRSETTRGAGFVLLVAALAGALDFAAYEASRSALRAGVLKALPPGAWLSGVAVHLDALAALLAFAWAASRPKRLVGLAIAIGVVVLATSLARAGAGHTASWAEVVLHRSLESLASRPRLTLPAQLAHSLSLLPLVLSAALLVVPGRSLELRAALALCLLGRTASGAPAAALLSVGAALAAIGEAFDGESSPRPAPVAPALKPR